MALLTLCSETIRISGRPSQHWFELVGCRRRQLTKRSNKARAAKRRQPEVVRKLKCNHSPVLMVQNSRLKARRIAPRSVYNERGNHHFVAKKRPLCASVHASNLREICLSVGFAAGIGRCDAKGILAGRISWAHPSEYSLFEEPQDRSAVLDYNPQPRRFRQHREIDSAKTKPGQENIDAITHMLIVQRRNCLGYRFRAVGVSPAVVQFGMRFRSSSSAACAPLCTERNPSSAEGA